MNQYIVINGTKLNNRKKSLTFACVIALLHPGLIAASMVVGGLVFQRSLTVGLLTAPIILIFVGTRFRAINNMSHECIHFAFTESRKANEIFGVIFAILEFSRFRSIRCEHYSHHAHLGNYKLDSDFNGLEKYKFWIPFSSDQILFHLKTAFSFRFLKDYVFFVIYDKNEPFWGKFLRFAFIVLLIAGTFLFPVAVGLFLLTPYFSTYQMHKYLIDALDHGGLLSNQNEINKTRNFMMANRFLKFLFFPRNDSYHLVHHLYPHLAVENFNAAHALLQRDPIYAAKTHQASEQLKQWLSTPDQRIGQWIS